MTIDNFAELEIAIRKPLGAGSETTDYQVEMRFIVPGGLTEERLLSGDQMVSIPASFLQPPSVSWQDYGKDLCEKFFAGEIKEKFQKARERAAMGARPATLAQAVGAAVPETRGAVSTTLLRIRLYIEARAGELHNVHWEAMADPDPANELPLFSNENISFSRYLTSGGYGEIRSREHPTKLKALVAVANPSDLAQKGAAPLPPKDEVLSVSAALSDRIDAEYLVNQRIELDGRTIEPRLVSLDNIIAELHNGYDILYLLCHGLIDLNTEAPLLYLDGPEGKTQAASAAKFVQLIGNLAERPRLIVLASCKSAGGDVERDAKADELRRAFTAAVGPRLAEAGIPAVLAMSGNMGKESAAIFIREFFKHLVGDAGQIDRAVSMARYAIVKTPDCWRPVLFMRLRSGKIWYIAGFAGPRNLDWDKICLAVKFGMYLPVLGPELPSMLYGTEREQAITLAHEFPLAAWDSWDLRKASQFVITASSSQILRTNLRDVRTELMRKRFPELSKKYKEDPNALREAIMEKLLQDEDNPYRVLVDNFRPNVYLTVESDSLLNTAMKKLRGIALRQVACDWQKQRDTAAGSAAESPPGPDSPALFFVFGRSAAESEDTWVLTEDDVFDYLIKTSRQNPWPEWATTAVTQRVMLFLGFPVDHWKLRLLLRMLYQSQKGGLIRGNVHYCVQVDPEITTMADVMRAKQYLETSFTKGQNINVYWGTAKEFLKELREQLTLRNIDSRKAQIASDD